MNNKILKNLILFSCIMILLLFSNSTLVQSIANDETPIVVKTFNQFKTALENANDGDVIYVDGNAIILDYDTNATIGYPNKTITIKKNGSTHILLTSTKNIKFQNIIFDGENTLSYEPFIKTYGEYYPLASAIFENVTFKNMNGNNNGMLFFDTGLTTFNNCTFTNNKGGYGGHIEIRKNAIVNFYKCSFTEGQSYCGGAIALMSSDSSCNIFSSTITNNSVNSEGGGIYNLGELTMENTKIYNNTASTGGSDIYNNGTLHIKDSIEDLQKLFSDSELKPIAWVSDYNDDSSYLKLEFGKIEEEKNDPKEDKNNENNNSSNDTNENDDNNQNIESNNPNENNSDNAENNQQNTSNEEKKDNKSEQNQENASTPTFDKDNKNESVTNNLHNNTESSFIQKIIEKINETFNIQNPSTQTITDTSSKSITNNHESPITPKLYISASPSTKVDSISNSNESENINPSNQSFNFSFEFKNSDNNNSNLIIIFVFIQSILVIFIFVIVIVQNKQNNRHHRYKNKKHTRKH